MDLNTEQTDGTNEEAIIESLFNGCDDEGSGFVKVSKLIDYLSAVVGDNVEFGGNFDELVMLLDQKGDDREVDIETFRKGMLDWIEGIRCQSYREEVYYSDEMVSPDIRRRKSEEEWKSLDGSGNLDVRGSENVTSDSVEGLGGESPLKQDWELVTKIEDLQLNNKRLVDHNAELSFQMENTEENNNQLLQEVTILRKQLRNYQTLDDKNKNIEKENEELRQTVTDLQETSQNSQNKAKQLEKDRVMLSEFQEELQTKLSAAHRRLESLSNDHKTVCLAYNEEKQKLIELEELQGAKDEVDKETIGTQEYLTNVISDLTAQKEALQTERNKMEDELYQVREDLNRLMVRNASTFSSTERRGVSRPAFKGKFCTTESSIQQEIQEIARDDCLPSPIVGQSPSFHQNSTYESDVFESSKSLTSPVSFTSLNSSSNSPFSKSNDYFTAVSQVAADFREKREKALHTISELVRLEKTRENKEIRESLQRELEKEMEFFAEKIWLLSLARKASEKRVSKLLALIETLKDENHRLHDERDKALQKIGNLSLGSEDMETRIEELTSELQATLEKSNYLEKRCSELQNKLKKTENELDYVKLEKEGHSSSIERLDDDLKSRYDELERKYKEVVEEREIALAKITKMEHEMERTSMDLAVEKKRSLSLQESLSLSVSKHEQELQDIMETIPTEAYNESQSRSNSKSSSISGYQVRNKLRTFLASKYLTIRDSPDGKPTNHDDEVPVGVSTPIDGNTLDSNDVPGTQGDTPQSTSNDNPKPGDTPYPNAEAEEGDHLYSDTRCISPESQSSRSKRRSQCSDLSSISPNLIRPYDEPDDRWSSPSLIKPFEAEDGRRNVTFTKPVCSTDLKEWQGDCNTLESFEGAESFGNPCDLAETENVANVSEDCAKNLLTEFVAEETSHSICLSSGQYSDAPSVGSDRDSAPVSPVVPARFRKISDIAPRGRRTGVAGSPPVIVPTKPESRTSSLPEDNEPNSTQTIEPKLIFTFDGPMAESYTSHNDGSRVPSRLTNSSAGCERASDSCDSDLRSTPGLHSSYIEGVSLNSSLPSDEKELEKLFKSVSLAFRTDKDSLPQRLEYQERARNSAEDDSFKSLQILSNGVKNLEQNVSGRCPEQTTKDSLSSLYQQIAVLNECTRRVSSQSHQYGSYQQEARMMSGVDVLISYGENLSRRVEVLAETISTKELQESLQANRSKTSNEETLNVDVEPSTSARRSSSLYDFVSSMRATDSFKLFSGGETSRVASTSAEANTTEENSEKATEYAIGDDRRVTSRQKSTPLSRRKNISKERSCLGRCVCCSIKLVAFFILLSIFLYFLLRYSAVDRYFIVDRLHDYLKSQRFEVIYYDHEPAV